MPEMHPEVAKIVAELQDVEAGTRFLPKTFKEKAPVFYGLVEKAYQHVTHDSDFQENRLIKAIAFSTNGKPSMLSTTSVEDNKTELGKVKVKDLLSFNPEELERMADTGLTPEEFVALIEHELGHFEQNQTSPLTEKLLNRESLSYAEKRDAELWADRHVADELAMVGYLLRFAKLEHQQGYTDVGSLSVLPKSHDEHPKDLNRVENLLREMIADEVFGNAGAFVKEGDGYWRFHPNRNAQNQAVNEKGEVIADWDAKESSMRQWLKPVMTNVERTIKEQGDIDALKTYLEQRVKVIKQKVAQGTSPTEKDIEAEGNAAISHLLAPNTSTEKINVANNALFNLAQSTYQFAQKQFEQDGLNGWPLSQASSRVRGQLANQVAEGKFVADALKWPDAMPLERAVADNMLGNATLDRA